MTELRSFFVGISVWLVLLGISAEAAFAQDPANGQVVWEEQALCQRCHGPAGEGLWAGPLAGSDRTAEEWIQQVRSPRQNMPMFEPEQVSDAMIVDMHAYISSLPPVTDFSRPDSDLPADAHPGQMLLVEKRCVACHTTTGPIQSFVNRGELPTAQAVIAQLRSPAQRMPSFSETQVSDQEAEQVAEFLAVEFNAAEPESTTPATSEAEAPAETQSTPPALPETGSTAPPTTLVMAAAVLLGAVLLLAGVVLRRLSA